MLTGRVVALTCALVMAGCSAGPSARSSAPAATTPTTATIPAALDAAREACRLGDTTSGTTTAAIQRIALGLHGDNTTGLSDAAVTERWIRLLQQPGTDTSELSRRAAAQVYGEAAAAAARAAALDPRWDDLHRGLSAYVAYWVNRSSPSDSESKRWFEDIRLGCERARAAPGP